jgi:hypothetical protein
VLIVTGRGIGMPQGALECAFCGSELILEFPTKSMPSGFSSAHV